MKVHENQGKNAQRGQKTGKSLATLKAQDSRMNSSKSVANFMAAIVYVGEKCCVEDTACGAKSKLSKWAMAVNF